jgi:hypothetical protein
MYLKYGYFFKLQKPEVRSMKEEFRNFGIQ